MSVDVEDWFQVGAFEKVIDKADWDALTPRVERNTDAVLALLAECETKATFFTLGWVAARNPAMIRRIVAQGHELASHGWDHQRVFTMDAAAFRADICRTRKTLEDAGGVAITGYRAPSFSIDARTPWAHVVLAEEGYAYSSSVAPLKHDHYGWPEAPRYAFRPLADAALLEVPVSVAELGGRRVATGGGFFRLFPAALTDHAVRQVEDAGQPAVFYFHPWEIDRDQPRVANASAKSKLRHYSRLGAMTGKLRVLLARHHWGRMDEVVRDLDVKGAIENRRVSVQPLSTLIAVRSVDLRDVAERARIEGFVRAHPAGTPFHLPAWSVAVAQGCVQTSHTLVAERADGSLAGILPMTEVRSLLFGKALVSKGFAVDGGILVELDGATQPLADAAAALAARLGCLTLELRGGAVPEGDWLVDTDTYLGFARPLAPNDDAELLAIPRKQRAEVRKALDTAFDISVGRDRADLAAHYAVYAESVRNLGTPVFPTRLFQSVVQQFGEEADILTIGFDGQPVASVLNLYFRDTVYPYWGGGTRAARSLRANDALYFALMRHARGRGCTRFDFGRSKAGTGAAAFKKNWGFEPTSLRYLTHAVSGGALRQINPKDPRYAQKVELWKKLPLWVANRIGPYLSRGLG